MRFRIVSAVLVSGSVGLAAEPPLAVLGPPVAVPHPHRIVPVANGIGYDRAFPPSAPAGRTSVHFSGPAGLKVAWQSAGGAFDGELTAPKEYNFRQGQTFRLRAEVAAGRTFYPTLEVAPATAKSRMFLAHASVPVSFSADDFAHENVVKVIYLPDPAHQGNGIASAEEVTSYRLEPGPDPVEEARRRGTILAVVRLGHIEMERPAPPGR